MGTAGHLTIDTLNAYCRPWLVQCLRLAQGRLNIHPSFGLALGFRELCARVALRFGQGFLSRLLGFHEPGLGVGKITSGRAC